jgi:hypothetical protein
MRDEIAFAVRALHDFAKLHALCGGFAVDTPTLRGAAGCRLIAACRCGDTIEERCSSVESSVLHTLLSRFFAPRVA